MKKYSQKEQEQILRKLNEGIIGKRKQGTWDRIVKKTIFSKKSVLEIAKKYNTLQEFRVNSNGAFQYAERYNFLDELNLERKFNTDRNFESVKESAKQYNSRYEFQLGDMPSYSKAQANGWLDEVCLHMVDKKIEYTFEMCKEIASQYSGRTEWATKHQNSYAKALRQEWVDIIFPKKKKCGRVKPSFTKSQIINLAKKYNKRSDFRRNEQTAMLFAKNQGWLNDILNEVFPK